MLTGLSHADDWVYSNNRKKQQRKMNKMIRHMNKHIEKDDLWKGRFYAKQVLNSYFTPYEDKSGAELFVQIEFRDKQTGKTMLQADTVAAWCHWNGCRLFEKMNYFITEWCQVWKEDPRPHRDTSIDYRRGK